MMKPPETEMKTGARGYASTTPGVGGRIKALNSDFIVEEILPWGGVCEIKGETDLREQPGKYLHMVCVKENWTTNRLVGRLSKRLHISRKRIGYAGVKDKRAVSSQRLSIYGVDGEALARVNLPQATFKDVTVNNVPVKLGDLWGNRFKVTVRDVRLDEASVGERLQQTMGELAAGVPNFFGIQRFGFQRPITHIVGKKILEKDFEGAVLCYLTAELNNKYESVEAAKFRSLVKETKDFKGALKLCPKNLGIEASLLNHLVKSEGDYLGALRSLPQTLSSFFIHGYQSYVFNLALSYCIEKGYSVERLPLVGYETKPDDVSARILKQQNIKPEDFRVPEVRKLASKGGVRDCFIYPGDFKVGGVSEDELNRDSQKITLSFKLSKGSYATVVLREYMKNRYWD
ncbi:MAG: tRNA pseudouridine(13) synthase TruD [Candidatus Altiarchaeales archaeon]|nr:tRNA pseudouridine(13) synthase TruD [Candidatus Altiarchaeales archaeon]